MSVVVVNACSDVSPVAACGVSLMSLAPKRILTTGHWFHRKRKHSIAAAAAAAATTTTTTTTPAATSAAAPDADPAATPAAVAAAHYSANDGCWSQRLCYAFLVCQSYADAVADVYQLATQACPISSRKAGQLSAPPLIDQSSVAAPLLWYPK